MNVRRLLPTPIAALAIAFVVPRVAAAQTVVALTPDAWNASDSLRIETFLGRPSVYINRGVALARGVALRDGTIEYDWAASRRTSFLGASFHATSPDNSESVFFRPGSSGKPDARHSTRTAWPGRSITVRARRRRPSFTASAGRT
jgi:hypothetical protein